MKTILVLTILVLATVASAQLTPSEKADLHEAEILKPVYVKMLADVDTELTYAMSLPKNQTRYLFMKYMKGSDGFDGMTRKAYVMRLFDIRNRYAKEQTRNGRVYESLKAKEMSAK